MKRRGYKPQFGIENLLDGIDKAFVGDYIVTMQALEINRARIKERLDHVRD